MRKCSQCNRIKEDREFSSLKVCQICSDKRKKKSGNKGHGSSEEWKTANRERLRTYNVNFRKSNKLKVLLHYGEECKCCGEKDVRFLTIDHENGGGCKHRAESGLGTGHSFYRWLIKQSYPEGYAVLCFNCNCGRSVNGGICPHKESELTVGT